MTSLLQKITTLELAVESIELDDISTLQGQTAANASTITNLESAKQNNITSVTDLNCNTLNTVGNITIGGIISAPNQISFSAYRTGTNIAVNTNIKLPLNATLYNIGGCYDTDTFDFTVPIAGTYYFYVSILRNFQTNYNGTITVVFLKNGVTYEQLENTGVQKHFAHMVVVCDVGDVVTVERRVGEIFFNRSLGGGAFAGFLIG